MEKLTRIANNELEKFSLDVSRCTGSDLAQTVQDFERKTLKVYFLEMISWKLEQLVSVQTQQY